jgi:hypothetical protein
MTARRPTRRFQAAAILIAVFAAGCATEDYGYAREHRFDRPYRGGAANVPDKPPQSTSCQSTKSETVAVLAYFTAIAIAIVGHADVSVPLSPPLPPLPPPPPPPSRP